MPHSSVSFPMARLRHDGYRTPTGMALLVLAIAFALHTELILGDPSPRRLVGYSPTRIRATRPLVTRSRFTTPARSTESSIADTRTSVAGSKHASTDPNYAEDEAGTIPQALVVPVAPIQQKPLCQFCHCKKVYLDCGTNLGVQIRKLYEPSRFGPKAQIIPFFDKFFGEDRSDVCAIGFEPNAHHSSGLNQIQEAYTMMGYNVKIHTRTAVVADDDGVTAFHMDDVRDGWSGLGSSIVQHRKTKKMSAVRTVNLARFIEENLSPDATIVMKLDIEGAEFTVFPQLLMSGVLCKYIDFAFVEWHDHMRIFQDSPIAKGLRPGPDPKNPEKGWNAKEIQLFVKAAVAADPKCNTELIRTDDESYHMMSVEKMPMPELVAELS